MSATNPASWQPMASAPKDGTRILVTIRASEQGPAEVDVVRWAKPDRSGDAGWIATDSDTEARFVYADAELAFWMPLPTVLPNLRSARVATGEPAPDEMDGSAI